MTPSNAAMQNQAFSLAGAAQFAQYAHVLATRGQIQPAHLKLAIQAITCTDPDTALDTLGGRTGAADGIRYVRTHLSGHKPDADNARIARYIGQILKLAGKLKADEQALGRISGAIERARSLEDDEEAARIFNAAYQDTLSHMKPQIMLQGEPQYLQNEYIQQRVRTHLLAAVRCGVMWRQCGGGFLSLFFRRKALLSALD